MGVLRHVCKTIKIVQAADTVDLTLIASWAGATDLGELKGKPYVKVTWDPTTYESQKGTGALGMTGKFELSSLELNDMTTLTALMAMRDLNVSVQCTPVGVVSATNPIILVKNFRLLIGGEINLGGDPSFIKLSGEKPCTDETDLFAYDINAAA